MSSRATLTTATTPAPPPEAGRTWNAWWGFAARRLARFAVSLALLVVASFWMIHLVPGDPVRAALGNTASPELIRARRSELGLDRPLTEQFVSYVSHLLHGDLGRSQSMGLPVSDVISGRLVPTVLLAVLAFVLVMTLALPIGMAAGHATWRRWRPRSEILFSGVSGGFSAVPDFLLGVGLISAFAIAVPVLPVAGRSGPDSYVLPVVALALGPLGLMLRIVRAETVRVLEQDYVRTARAKRLPVSRLFARHVLPNVLTPTLTLSGLLLSGLLAGTVLVENLFAWPGLGTALVQSVLSRDYALVQGLALVFGSGVLVVNLLVDVLIALADPRSALRDA